MSRRWLIAAIAGLLLLVDGAAWLVAQRALSQGFDAALQATAMQGVALTAGTRSAGGWPVAASVTLPDATLLAGAVTLQTAHLVLSLSPLHPTTLRVTFPDPVSVVCPGLPRFVLAAASWQVEVPFADPRTAAIRSERLGITVARASRPDRTVLVARLGADIAKHPDGLHADLHAEHITLPRPLPGEIWPLGPDIASASVVATLVRPLVDRGLIAAALDVTDVEVRYDPLGVSGKGRFGLDARLQLVGEARLRLVGYGRALDAMVASGALAPHAAKAIGAVLGLMASGPPDEVDVPLTVRDQAVAVAGFPLARLPDLALPSRAAVLRSVHDDPGLGRTN